MRNHRLLAIALPLLAAPMVGAQEEAKETEVKPGTFRHQVVMEGYLSPASATPVQVDPKQWKTLLVKDFAAHGTIVKKGDPIVTFDVEKLEEHVENVGRSRQTAKLEMERAELELATVRKIAPLDLQAAREAAERAKESLESWKSTWRPLQIEEYKRDLQASEQALEYTTEELRQLQIMYKADDLTEETEEITLKRSKWAVERAEFALRTAKEQSDRGLKLLIPRTDRERQDAYDRAAIALERVEKDHARGLQIKELEFVEKRHAFEKEEKNFAELRADLDLLRAVRAPADGRMLWGDWTADEGPGKFAELEKKRAGAPRAFIAPQDIFATVVSGVPNRIHGSISPENRGSIGWRGPDAEAQPNGTRHATIETDPEMPFGVRILSVDSQPDAQGRFGMTLAFDNEALADDDLPPVVAGLKARVVLAETRIENALTVPANLIETSFANGQRVQSVYVKAAEGSPEKRTIETGARGAKGVVVTNGLKAGEKIVPLP
ncbi:MAG: hypothetical protein ACKO2G_05285 [Verrucomicrobiales bacterium]